MTPTDITAIVAAAQAHPAYQAAIAAEAAGRISAGQRTNFDELRNFAPPTP